MQNKALANGQLWPPVATLPERHRKRILVTGGAGFVGSHMVERLLEEYPKATIKVVDNLWRGRLRNLVDEKTGVEMLDFLKHVCVEDLTEPEVAVRLTKHAEAVFHLADIVAGIDFVFSNQPCSDSAPWILPWLVSAFVSAFFSTFCLALVAVFLFFGAALFLLA